MKKIFLFILFFNTSLPAETVQLKLDEVAKKVIEQNYLVQENATKVYQARKSIQQARGELLPKLNIWRIAKSILGGFFSPGSMIESVSDIAPFLVPNNWFRVQENKILYRAEKEAYRALWANEILNAKTLYMRALYDKDLLKLIQEELGYLDTLVIIAKSRVISGVENQEVLQKFQIWQIDLQEDVRRMKLLINEELRLISYAVGEPVEDEIDIETIDLPDLININPIKYNDFAFRVLDSSAERRQQEYFLSVIPYLKKEVKYAFLGGSTISRGVAGGVFDHLPIADSLGFGRAAQLDIIKGEEKKISLQKKGIEETLKRQLNKVVKSHNSSIESFNGFKKRSSLTNKLLKQHFRRLRMGDEKLDLMDIMTTAQQHAVSRDKINNTQYEFLINKNRLERLIFHGDYSSKPVIMEEVE